MEITIEQGQHLAQLVAVKFTKWGVHERVQGNYVLHCLRVARRDDRYDAICIMIQEATSLDDLDEKLDIHPGK